MSEENEVIETNETNETVESTDPEVIESEAANTETETAETDKEHDKEDKIQKRIDRAIYEKHQAKREAEQARREYAELKARLEESGEGDGVDPNEIHGLIQQEAARLRADESFNESCNKTYDVGIKEFGVGFDKAMQNLSLVGMSRDFLELVSTADNGAKILNVLGHDLDEADRISAMPPLQMARELTKLDIKLGSAKVKAISKAPEPIKPVSGKSSGAKSPAEMSDAEYAKWRRSR